ncbi:MAG: cation-translocating P-type ATPase [Nitrospinota bacterium]|nr:cation-translocating P-type ATPase [Nitrospinota bacterium]
MNTSQFWHTLSTEQVLDRLSATHAGLSSDETRRRQFEHGLNELVSADHVSPWTVFANQFKNILIIILLIATVISAFLGHAIESIAIAVIVLFAIILGFIQEYRAERAIEALKKMAAPFATVLRDGEEVRVPARDLVPGDLIRLGVGDKIPADSRLVEVMNLKVDESSLTGESVSVEKQSSPLVNETLPIGDRNNMVFSGTVITYGRGQAVVVATGMLTEFGKITGLLKTVRKTKTPLQENLDRVGKILAVAALAVVLLIVFFGFMRGEPLLEMFLFGIALAVAVVPEALPAVVTISLAIGVQRMARRNALMRHLPTVETLGGTSVICSDKTGTLTRDEMTARRIWIGGRRIEVTGTGYEPKGTFSAGQEHNEIFQPLTEFLRAATLASDARLVKADGEWSIKGDPTEGALVVAAAKAGLHKDSLEREWPRINEIPFSSERKRMTTLHEGPDGMVAFSKGAPEVVLAACTRHITGQGESPLDEEAVRIILDAAREMTTEALRVLAVAYKPAASIADAEKEMIFLGLAGMIDPPRPEAAKAIETCSAAGIRPVMITGDHPGTGEAVARELGLLKTGHVVTGAELEAMSDTEFDQKVETIEVYARVSPEHKLRVVTALQKKSHVVAMTGDGVNDAPALKKADVGIAMGITGTDVSREASDMILTDDNFASIVGAVEEGRGIFGNIKKYLMYLLSSNIGEIGLIAGAVLTGLPLPLTAVQILYVNLATDGLPALALSVDPPESDLMKHPPRDSRKGNFTRTVIFLMLVGGIWSALVNLGLFIWALKSERSVEQAMTLTFLCLILIQFLKAYNFRSDQHPVFHKPFVNKWLNLAILWELVLMILIVYVPVLHRPFGTFSLGVEDWTLVAGLALTIIPVLEIGKWMIRRGWLDEGP